MKNVLQLSNNNYIFIGINQKDMKEYIESRIAVLKGRVAKAQEIIQTEAEDIEKYQTASTSFLMSTACIAELEAILKYL